METCNITVKLVNNGICPDFETAGAAGADIRADLTSLGVESITLLPGEYRTIPTGVILEFADLWLVDVRSRSGLAANSGIAVLNSPGTIDSDYNEEVKVILVNHSNRPYTINQGDRIAQLVIHRVPRTYYKHIVRSNSGAITEVQISDRRDLKKRNGGLGSTGRS